MLEDGTYDALVVDADVEETTSRARIDLVIVAGAHKGEVVSVRAALSRDPIDLLGIPATIVVRDGEPRVHFEPGA